MAMRRDANDMIIENSIRLHAKLYIGRSAIHLKDEVAVRLSTKLNRRRLDLISCITSVLNRYSNIDRGLAVTIGIGRTANTMIVLHEHEQ